MGKKARIKGGFTVFDYRLPTRNPDNGVWEKHLPFGNWIGPGTRVRWRIAQGIRPTTNTDAGARVHDIEYNNIATRIKNGHMNPAQAKEAIRTSDLKLVRTATANLGSRNPIEKMHAYLGSTGIIGKNAIEDLGLLSETKFVDPEHAEDQEIPEGAGKKKKKRKKRSDAKPKKKKDRVKTLRNLFKKTKIA